MDLKTCRFWTRILYVICIALILIALTIEGQMLRMGLLGAALALVIILTVLRDKFWRCPQCGGMLPKSGRVRCEACGWEMM